MENKKLAKIIISIGVLIIILSLIALVYLRMRGVRQDDRPTNASKESRVATQPVSDIRQAGLPLEKDVEVLIHGQQGAPNIVYVSELTIKENVSVFKDFFDRNGYNITSDFNQEDQSILVAENEEKQVMVAFTGNVKLKRTTVTATIIKSK